ncbi:hypothetical protein P170DRAFT_480377 [Aspergillus steynii IBT 23096]|uniref:Uncharacterized protein n=1 Tax=Aspergillus steynii IBT 23096 TaxID=1392250 RepID=A0A2I2FVF8_9EURO|nr:uncharacterized protein P170DRAFT_480377 [Aspergillus steynii IBT 23096]PLB44629.1 hypothetical protein P170DRAFT_480377 [Aspergillus steynii IBT 23096]
MTSRFNREKFSNRATIKVPEDPADQDTQGNQQEGVASMEPNAQREFAAQGNQASSGSFQTGTWAAPETAERRGTRYSFTHDELADPDE